MYTTSEWSSGWNWVGSYRGALIFALLSAQSYSLLQDKERVRASVYNKGVCLYACFCDCDYARTHPFFCSITINDVVLNAQQLALLKTSQNHLACPFEKAVLQSRCRLPWFNRERVKKKKKVYAVFSIHSTNPCYNIHIVALSFNPCIGKLVQSRRRRRCCFPKF